MRDAPTPAARGRLARPLLALSLTAAAGLAVRGLNASQGIHGPEVPRTGSGPRSVARAAPRTGDGVSRRGALVREPTTQAEARATVRFCDRASAHHADALRETALRAGDPLAAANAVRALGRLRLVAQDREFLDLLGDPRPRVRHETILALGESRSEAAVPFLAPLLRGGDAKARTLAIHALGRVGGADARARLREVIAEQSASREDRAFARAGCPVGAR